MQMEPMLAWQHGERSLISSVIIKADESSNPEVFERKIYVIRKRFSHLLRQDKSLLERNKFMPQSLNKS